MPTIFEYEPRNTFLHRLNPIAKIVMLLSIFTVLTVYWDPKYVVVIAIISTILYVVSKTPPKWLLIILPVSAIRFIESLILGISQAQGAYFHYLPPEIAGRTLAKIGPITIIYGGVLWTISDILKIISTIMLTFSFIYTTSLNDIVKTLSLLRIPRKLIYVFIVALKLVPDILREINTTMIAQKLRGWELSSKNPAKIVKQAIPLAYPFLRKTLEYVDTLTMVAYIRGFNVSGKARLKWKPKFTISDYVVIVFSFSATIVSLYYALEYGVGLI